MVIPMKDLTVVIRRARFSNNFFGCLPNKPYLRVAYYLAFFEISEDMSVRFDGN